MFEVRRPGLAGYDAKARKLEYLEMMDDRRFKAGRRRGCWAFSLSDVRVRGAVTVVGLVAC